MIFWNIGNKFFLLFPVGIFFKRGEYNSDFFHLISPLDFLLVQRLHSRCMCNHFFIPKYFPASKGVYFHPRRIFGQ